METYTWPEQLQKLSGLTRTHYSKLVSMDANCAETVEGIPVFATIRAMNNALNQAGVYSTTRNRSDMDTVKINMQMQFENLTKSRILNQTKLGILIKKDEAYKRVLKFLYAFQNLLQHTIKMTAAKMPGNKRENEIFLTTNYNDCVNFLKENAVMLSWEEDGSHYITKTRLDALADIDLAMEKEIEDLNDLESLNDLNKEEDIINEELSES